jgi:hypothetical protein
MVIVEQLIAHALGFSEREPTNLLYFRLLPLDVGELDLSIHHEVSQLEAKCLGDDAPDL